MTEAEAFKLLALKPGASPAEVRKRYHDNAWDAHPDLGGDPALFSRLGDANRLALAVAYSWPCEACKGTGEIAIRSKTSFGGTAGKVLCGRCGGTGKKW